MDESDLLKSFCIDKKGSPDFKGRIQKVNSQKPDEEKQISQVSCRNSAFSELACANFISSKNEEIIDLFAWNSTLESDIKSLGAAKQEVFTEVKYLGEIPEITRLVFEAQKSRTGTAARTISPVGKIYNYIAFVIANAVCQLDSRKINLNQRRVCVIVDSSIDKLDIFRKYLEDGENWFEQYWPDLERELTFKNGQKDYIKTPVSGYLERTSDLILFERCNDWNLKIHWQKSFLKRAIK